MEGGKAMPVFYPIALVLVVLLFAYLAYAIAKPERF
jgi:K+-transporting ATPase KdpF subunit